MHQHGDCVAIEDSRNGLSAASLAAIPVVITRSVYFRDDDCSKALIAVEDSKGVIGGVSRPVRSFPHCTKQDLLTKSLALHNVNLS